MLRSSFNENWYVEKVGTALTRHVGPITLPYDAMLHEHRDPDTAAGQNTGFYPGGSYQFSKTFFAPTAWVGGNPVLEFEGVFHRSRVFINGHLAGGRPSGYTVFHVPLTGHLIYGAENIIDVQVDTSDQPNTRWYTGSGIYRPVHLLVGGPVQIDPFGLRLRTLSVSGGAATIAAAVDITNNETTPVTTSVEVTLTAASGRQTSFPATQTTVAAGETATVDLETVVSDADLWSPDSPALYEVQATLTQDDAVVDQFVDNFGIRTLTVDARHGLRINGVTHKLRGACIHHDNGVIGAIELDAAADRRIRILKKAGYNSIRSAHNPISAALLRACDRHGVMVMDELTDAWYFPKQTFDYGVDFEEWWQRDLDAMIAKGFNHPSVIMYSIGNEIAETSQPKGIALNRRMAEHARTQDPTRPVTNGINLFLNLIAPNDAKKQASVDKARESGESSAKNMIAVLNFAMSALEKVLPRLVRLKKADERSRDAFADLDIAGYNYAAGRYRIDGERYPTRVIVGTETSPPDLAKNWRLVEELPYVLGDFGWTGWDYIGEAGLSTKRYGEPRRLFLPYPALLAGAPVVDITGQLQTQAHLNRIIFGLDNGPFLAVQPVNHAGEKQSKTGWRSTNSVHSWAWDGCEGRVATVEVYANARRVELQLNGLALGTRVLSVADDFLATFQVPYAAGELVAIAYDESGREIGRDVLRSAGSELRLTVTSDVDSLRADGTDLAHVTIEFTDANGTLRPRADSEITVRVSGAGELVGSGSANAITTDEFAAGRFTPFYGRGLAVVRSALYEGDITITVSSIGVEPVTLTIPAHASARHASEVASRN